MAVYGHSTPTITDETLAIDGKIGRGDWIRTSGLSVPNRALYQAEPRPEEEPSLAVSAISAQGSPAVYIGTRWMNSHVIVTVSISTSDAPAFNAPISIFAGHAFSR